MKCIIIIVEKLSKYSFIASSVFPNSFPIQSLFPQKHSKSYCAFLPNYKVLNLSKFRVYADENLSITKFVFYGKQIIVRKGEYARY